MIRVVLVDGERHEFPTPAWRSDVEDGVLYLSRYRNRSDATLQTLVDSDHPTPRGRRIEVVFWPVRLVRRFHYVADAVQPAFAPPEPAPPSGQAVVRGETMEQLDLGSWMPFFTDARHAVRMGFDGDVAVFSEAEVRRLHEWLGRWLGPAESAPEGTGS